MSVLQISSNNFDTVKNSEKTVLLDFFAEWCAPCRMLSPVVDAISEERDDILVGKINVDEEPDLAQKFNVISIPTLVVMKNGEVVNRATGSRPKSGVLSLIDG